MHSIRVRLVASGAPRHTHTLRTHLVGLVLGAEELNLQVGLLAEMLPKLVILQLAFQKQLVPSGLGLAGEHAAERLGHPGGEEDRCFFLKGCLTKHRWLL